MEIFAIASGINDYKAVTEIRGLVPHLIAMNF